MARSEFTQKTKLEALAKYARCPKCGGQFGKLSEIDFDHELADGLGGDNTVDNCVPLCKACHKLKTNGKKHTTLGSDKHAIAKSKRLRGLTKTGTKKPIQSRGFQTNKDSEFKAKFGGGVERRK
tara:strand:- start:2256 stop:2627 length:372 start_codon:yes stop_codon:yes gene_type:complete